MPMARLVLSYSLRNQGEWRSASWLALSTTSSLKSVSFIATWQLVAVERAAARQPPNLRGSGGLHLQHKRPILPYKCLVHRLRLCACSSSSALKSSWTRWLCPHHTCSESLLQGQGHEFTREFVSRFAGIPLNKVGSNCEQGTTVPSNKNRVKSLPSEGPDVICVTLTTPADAPSATVKFAGHR